MQGFTVVDLVILVIYLAAVLFAGLHFAKKEMKGKEYFKGDGTVPWWVTSVSIFATLLSPISFLSLAGNSYAGTWKGRPKASLKVILQCCCRCYTAYSPENQNEQNLKESLSVWHEKSGRTYHLS